MTNQNPLVSIIIPTFNRAHLIGETLDSVLAQTYPNWECIVVDDGSTDNTDEVMAAYMAKDTRFQYHHRPEDRLPGGNAARNYGFEVSRGEYIQWFDSDDIMLTNFLAFKISHLSESINIVIANGYKANSDFSELRKLKLDLKNDLYTEYTLWKLRVMSPSVLFRKSFLNNKKLFNEVLARSQEAEFFNRVFYTLDNSEYKLFDEPLFYYRQHEASKTWEHTNKYKPEYSFSHQLVHYDNLLRGLELKNKEVFLYHYNWLISFYFRAIRNKDLKNSVIILDKLVKLANEKSSYIMLEMKLVHQVFKRIPRGTYILKKRWAKFDLFNENSRFKKATVRFILWF